MATEAAPSRPRYVVSHVRPNGDADEEWGSSLDFRPRGLRAFFEYRDIGVAEATAGRWGAHLIRKIPDAHGTTGPHFHSGLDFQLVLGLRDTISFAYKGVPEVVHYRAGSAGYQNPGVWHEEQGCGDSMVLLEVVSPGTFGTSDLSSSSMLATATADGGPVTPKSKDRFNISHPAQDGSDFVRRSDGGDLLYRDLGIARATNGRCSAHVFRSAGGKTGSARRLPSPLRLFLQLSGSSTLRVGADTVELRKGSTCLVQDCDVLVQGTTGDCFELWEEGPRHRM
ncbi:hypothetical protein DFJ74DRAFT_694252 [Hyaloraphidium curvatum]|nr:hypothetical protein DFJ74DRAFT_694252 [Hyaloraphidium curvatum]